MPSCYERAAVLTPAVAAVVPADGRTAEREVRPTDAGTVLVVVPEPPEAAASRSVG